VTDRANKEQLQARLEEVFPTIDGQRLLTRKQLQDGEGRSVTGHAAIENMDKVSAIVFVFWNPDRGVRLKDEYELNPDGTMREMRKILGGRGSSLFQACQNMILAAQALGVQSLFTTFFGLIEPDVKRILGVPPRMFLESAVFLGYGDEPLKSPRRRPLPDVAHRNTYGQPFQPVFDPE
jgi:nitroreductase